MNRIITFTLFFTFYLNTGFSQNWDTRTLIRFNEHFKNDQQPLYLFSETIYPMAVVLPVTGLTTGYVYKNEKMFLSSAEAILAMGVTYIGTKSLKTIVNRSRPYEAVPGLTIYKETPGRSFPSGHTSIAFSLATTLSINYTSWYIITPAFLYAGSIAYSRISLGQHYPSDVLAGSLLGIGSALLTHYTCKWLMDKAYTPRLRRFDQTAELSLSVPPSYEMILE